MVHWLRTLDIGVAFTNEYEQAVLEEYEMKGGTKLREAEPFPVPLHPHESHMDWSGIEPWI